MVAYTYIYNENNTKKKVHSMEWEAEETNEEINIKCPETNTNINKNGIYLFID